MIALLRHLRHEGPRHTGLVPAAPELACSPWAASFCRVHGACCCWAGVGPSVTSTDISRDCQLHNPLSSHGIEHTEASRG